MAGSVVERHFRHPQVEGKIRRFGHREASNDCTAAPRSDMESRIETHPIIIA
jgi:hypothetical protein